MGRRRTFSGYGLFLFCVVLTASTWAQDDRGLFPRPAELDPDVRFWTRVYTEIDTRSGFIHDSRYLGVVYQTIRFSAVTGSRSRSRQARNAIGRYRDVLEALAGGKREGLTDEEQRVLALWPEDVSNKELREASRRLRFQLGQSDRFKAGVIRAGTWKPYIYEVLRERGLPRELAVLPHVESSFDPTAYSKVGAAGLWQFTRSTGLRYMRIDHVVDERRDPFLSTVAAARLLENNYEVIQSWPLALTAYNHGLAGMRRAVREHGTRDVDVIVRNYRGRTFGFASRNFYVAFLAALEVDSDPERYFGPLQINPPAETALVRVPDYMEIDTLQAALGINRRELSAWNPALMEPVWRGDKFVPKGFYLRVPQRLASDPGPLLAAVPDGARYAAQRPDVYHRIRRGETLSGIAEQYGVSVSSLVAANGLRSSNFIRAGQTLTLPVNDGTAPMTLAQLDGTSTYVVRAGDSIARIARMFGVDEQSLLAQNDIRNRNLIYAGQSLRIGQTADEAPAQTGGPEPVMAAVASQPVEPAAVGESEPEPLPPAPAEPASVPEEPAAVLAVSEDFAGEDFTIETDALESNVLASTQADLAADPSDYSVAADKTIEVHALETLGHYADWLEIRTQRLRDINGMPFRQAVVVGRRLALDFSVIDAATFEQRRRAYHQELQEAFFQSYQITETLDHVVRSGESLWVLALRIYRVPVWLLRQYNPDLDLDRVAPGTVVKFPQLKPIAQAEDAGVQANSV